MAAVAVAALNGLRRGVSGQFSGPKTKGDGPFSAIAAGGDAIAVIRNGRRAYPRAGSGQRPAGSRKSGFGGGGMTDWLPFVDLQALRRLLGTRVDDAVRRVLEHDPAPFQPSALRWPLTTLNDDLRPCAIHREADQLRNSQPPRRVRRNLAEGGFDLGADLLKTRMGPGRYSGLGNQ